MISLVTRYIFFIQLIFSSFTTFSISVKTYQVRRINDTTFLVTRFPEFDFDNKKRYLEANSTNNYQESYFPLMQQKHTTEDYEITTVSVGDKRPKPKPKITSEVIKKARENYFRRYFSIVAKTNTNISLLPEGFHTYTNMVEGIDEADYSNKLKQNLMTAKKLAGILLSEGKFQAPLKFKEKYLFDEMARTKRKPIKASKRTSYHRRHSAPSRHRSFHSKLKGNKYT